MSHHAPPTIELDRLVEKLERIRFGLQIAEARMRESNPAFADMLSDLSEEAEGVLYLYLSMGSFKAEMTGQTSDTP